MTKDELRAAILAGKSYDQIARESGMTKDTISTRIGRYRQHEGEDLWPRRPPPQPKPKIEQPQRAGKVTLPPLASLRGETSG